MDDHTSFGAWLKRRRYVLGLTQDELARRVGYSASLIQKVEASERRPSRQMVERLTNQLTVDDDQPTALLEIAAGAPVRRTYHNLPVPLTSFVGRAAELTALARLIGQTRLLTLIGPGGVGKTRLALSLAADMLEIFPDGVWLVKLAPLVESTLVPQTVIAALGLREQLGRTPTLALTAHLHDRRILLVLDNCEHLIDACAQLADELLRAGAGVHILATSREPLGITGETIFLVPLLAEQPACMLFAERARAIQPEFTLSEANAATVTAICRRIDGLPLAIELAAARLRLLTADQIRSHLDDDFGLLAGGSRTADKRHQSVHMLIDWSYALLTPPERVLLQRLAVFSGGWSLAAAEAVARTMAHDLDAAAVNVALDPQRTAFDLISSLLDKSLIGRVDRSGGESRFSMLETIRQFALERLAESGAEEDARKEHARFFVQLVETTQPPDLRPPAEPDLDQLDLELGNIRAAFSWMLRPGTSGAEHTLTLRLAAALEWYWRACGSNSEGLRWTHAALQTAGRTAAPARRMMALKAAVWVALELKDADAARPYLSEYQKLARMLEQAPLIADSIRVRATVAALEGHQVEAERLAQAALTFCRAEGDELGSAFSLTVLARQVEQRGDDLLAATFFEEAVAIARKLGYMSGAGIGLTDLGRLALNAGKYVQALRHFQEGLALKWNDGWRATVPYSLDCIARVLAAQGDNARAIRLLSAAAALRPTLSSWGLPEHKALLHDLRTRLSETTIAAAWAAGQALSLEQAVAEALVCDDADARL
jgi:predicted ATPase